MSILSVIEIIFWCFKLLQTLPSSLKRSQRGKADKETEDEEIGSGKSAEKDEEKSENAVGNYMRDSMATSFDVDTKPNFGYI